MMHLWQYEWLQRRDVEVAGGGGSGDKHTGHFGCALDIIGGGGGVRRRRLLKEVVASEEDVSESTLYVVKFNPAKIGCEVD